MGLFDKIAEKIRPNATPGAVIGTLSEDGIKLALSAVMDPDLHKDIVTLGFVRNIKIDGSSVALEVNLTTPACPVKEQLKSQVEFLPVMLC